VDEKRALGGKKKSRQKSETEKPKSVPGGADAGTD